MFDLLRIASQCDGLASFKKKTGFCVLAYYFDLSGLEYVTWTMFDKQVVCQAFSVTSSKIIMLQLTGICYFIFTVIA